MKKVLSFVLALVMMTTLLCSPALAARVGTDSPDQTTVQDIKIKLDPAGIVHKYCIDIEFPDPLVFTYSEEGGTWDPEEYNYVGGGVAGWSGNGNIKITNHSDMPVEYVVSTQDVVATYGALTVNVANGTGEIERCTVGTAVGSKNATAVLSISGPPNSALTTTAVKLGEVKVVISKP